MKDNQELTKGERMAVMAYRELSDETKASLFAVKQKAAQLIGLAEHYKTEANAREIALAQTYFEIGIMFLTKAIINENN